MAEPGAPSAGKAPSPSPPKAAPPPPPPQPQALAQGSLAHPELRGQATPAAAAKPGARLRSPLTCSGAAPRTAGTPQTLHPWGCGGRMSSGASGAGTRGSPGSAQGAALAVGLPAARDAQPRAGGLPGGDSRAELCAGARRSRWVPGVAQPRSSSLRGAKSPLRDRDLGCSHSLSPSSGGARRGRGWQGQRGDGSVWAVQPPTRS